MTSCTIKCPSQNVTHKAQKITFPCCYISEQYFSSTDQEENATKWGFKQMPLWNFSVKVGLDLWHMFDLTFYANEICGRPWERKHRKWNVDIYWYRLLRLHYRCLFHSILNENNSYTDGVMYVAECMDNLGAIEMMDWTTTFRRNSLHLSQQPAHSLIQQQMVNVTIFSIGTIRQHS